jgi:hypothetical protein
VKARAREMAALARARLLDPSPKAVERLETAAAMAISTADWKRAKMLVAYRRELSGLLRDSPDQLAFFARLAENINTADARGWGPELGQGAKDNLVPP